MSVREYNVTFSNAPIDLFVCDICNHVDSMGLSIDVQNMQGGFLNHQQPSYQCTKCLTGTWHDRFEYRVYDPAEDLVCNRATGIGLG